MSDIGHEYIDH